VQTSKFFKVIDVLGGYSLSVNAKTCKPLTCDATWKANRQFDGGGVK